MPASEFQIATAHIENADTASAAVGVASATQRVYVLAVYYRNGTGGTLTPKLVSNSKTIWAGTAQLTAVANFYNLASAGIGLPVSDGVNQAVTFSSTASATSDLTVWYYYGP